MKEGKHLKKGEKGRHLLKGERKQLWKRRKGEREIFMEEEGRKGNICRRGKKGGKVTYIKKYSSPTYIPSLPYITSFQS